MSQPKKQALFVRLERAVCNLNTAARYRAALAVADRWHQWLYRQEESDILELDLTIE